MDELETAKDVYILAKPFVDPLVQSLIKPKLLQLSDWLTKEGVKKDIIDHAFNNKFQEYLLRTFENCHNLNTIVFPNQQVKLDDIYLPAELINTRNYRNIRADKLDSDFLQKNDRILVSDYAGMGKSTFSKFLCNHCITQNIGIPILIELRKLKNDNLVLKEIFEQINPIDKSFKEEFILKLISRGDFIIIFDGFDEIPSAIQETVIADLRNFISKAPKNRYVLTSRPEAALSSFGDFQNYFIKPLSESQAHKLIRKYDQISKINISDRLIEDLNDRREQIKDFLTNPFLVSLLYKSYTYNKDIPTKRVTFYEEVYNALYKAHDLSKDGFKRPKRSSLDIQDFRVVLRDLAFSTAKMKEVEYTEQELLNYINESNDHCSGINFKESDFLEDLLLTVPLLQRDGNKVKWAHKSIQDYFAAEFVCFHNKEEEILSKIYQSRNEAFLNILALIQELDNKTFRKIILLTILEDFIRYYENSYSDFKQNDDVHDRKILSYGIKMCFLKADKEIDHEDARTIVKKEFPKLEKENFYSSQNLTTFFFKLSSYDYNRELLELLYTNNKHLFLTNPHYKRSFSREDETKICPENYKPQLLDDSTDNHINSKEAFSIINSWLMETITNRRRGIGINPIVLDIESCRQEVARIKLEINKEDKLDILEGI